MSHDVWTPMITINSSLRNKSLRARNNVELLRGLCRDMLWLPPIETNNARNKTVFCFPKKKKSKKQKIPTTFGKSLFLIKYRMRYMIYMPLNTLDLAITQTMVAHKNRQNSVCTSKQLRFVVITGPFNSVGTSNEACSSSRVLGVK